MPIFKKKPTPSQPQPAGSVGETGFVGTELHVNPPPDVSLARMEARLERVEQSLASGKWPVGSEREMSFQTIKRRLEAQIAIHKGDI